MKFLFIFPSHKGYQIADKKHFPVNPYSPPLGILYLAAVLENEGHTVEVIDYTAEHQDHTALAHKLSLADAVGITICTGSLSNAKNLAEFIKQTDPELPLLLGGPHCSFVPRQTLQNLSADICVQGEAEPIISQIASALEGKQNLSNIPGIYYKEHDTIHYTTPLKPLDTLDELLFPARHLVEKYDYGYMLEEKMTKGKTTSIITSRGCPYQCTFCGYTSVRPGFHLRSAENVLCELEEIKRQGYESVIFVDNNFLVNKKRDEQILDGIIQKKYDFTIWIEGSRVDLAHKRLYEKMKKAGVTCISLGLESGNQDILNFYKKHTTLAQIHHAVQLSKDMGFTTSGSFVLGAPIETKKQINQTIKLAQSLPLDVAHFVALGYLCGSPLWKEAVASGKIQPDEFAVPADIRRGLGNFTEEELKNYCIKAHRSVHFNPRFILRQLCDAIRKKDFHFIKAGFRMLTIKEE